MEAVDYFKDIGWLPHTMTVDGMFIIELTHGIVNTLMDGSSRSSISMGKMIRHKDLYHNSQFIR